MRDTWGDERIVKMVSRAREDGTMAFGRSDKQRTCTGVTELTKNKPGLVATSLSGCLFRLISTANGSGKAAVNKTCARALELGSFKDTPDLVMTKFGAVIQPEVAKWLA